MNEKALREAYKAESEIRRLVQWAINRQRNAWVTSLDAFERELGLSRPKSVRLAERVESLGCGKYVKGRRGRKSRVLWYAGLWRVVDVVTKPSAYKEAA
jgi:hypothetical protein